MNIDWTRPAVRDLRSLRAYIAEHNTRAAESIALKIVDSVDQLAAYPASGRPGGKPYTRELVVPQTNYFIVYRVRDDVVEILRMIHGAQQWP